MFYFKKYLLLCVFLFPALLRAETEAVSPLDYLQMMTNAHQKSNYELLYILQQQNSAAESFRLRHTFVDDKAYAQQLNLDSSREEIILKDQTVSYLGNNFRPFSLKSGHILDNLPSVLYTDFPHLQGYSFLDAGRDRIADRLTRVVRLVPNDNFHYAYTLWIDEETHLLLKSVLLGEENAVLEEFRALQLYQSQDLTLIASAIDNLMLPALSATEKNNTAKPHQWQAEWLPTGFRLVENQTMNGKPFLLENAQIDSQLYSDGLSTLNIYVMPSQGVNFNEYAWQQGKLTVLNQTVNDKDIVIIGEIPLESAKQIMKNIRLSGEKPQ